MAVHPPLPSRWAAKTVWQPAERPLRGSSADAWEQGERPVSALCPAQPPGPGEVVGCILTAYRDRTRGYVSAADDRGGMTFPEWWATVPEGERERLVEAMEKIAEMMNAHKLDAAPILVTGTYPSEH